MRLIYKWSKDGTKQEVKIGDKVKDRDGEELNVSQIVKPHHGGSTGRVYVKSHDGHENGFYPSVFDMEWIEREDQD